MSRKALCILIGCITLLSSILYIVSDGIELLSSGFSTLQLSLTYAAFAMVPFFIVGLFALQRPKAGWLGLIGTVAYGVSFVFYAGTVIYALTAKTADYANLVRELGLLYTLHGGLLVVGGTLFGAAVIQAKILPRWTGLALIVGVVLNLVINFSGLPDIYQLIGSTIRNVAFAGMALGILLNTSLSKAA